MPSRARPFDPATTCGALGMEQSVWVRQVLVFRSPAPMSEVIRRINENPANSLIGGIRAFYAGNRVPVFGKVRGNRLRLRTQRGGPLQGNNSEPILDGTLELDDGGGTILKAQWKWSASTWSRDEYYNAEQMNRIVDGLARISGLQLITTETT